MKIFICDDDSSSRAQIKTYLDIYGPCSHLEISEFATGVEMIRALKSGHADIIFLDIEMEIIDGIDTAKLIRITDRRAIIIFVSSHQERVFDAFDCEAFHFITKPFTQQKFNDVFAKAIQKYKFLNKTIPVQWKNTSVELPIEKIKYFESYRKHVIFHTYDGEYQMIANLSDVLNELSPYGFTQTHQGYAVNMNLIRRFDGLDILLDDGTKVPMSVRKKAEVVSTYAKYVTRYKA